MGVRQFRAGVFFGKSPIYSDLILQIYLGTNRRGGHMGLRQFRAAWQRKAVGRNGGSAASPGPGVFVCVEKSHF
jgi:hypothetical protein